MTNYRRIAPTHPQLAGEVPGVFDASPLAKLQALLDQQQAVQRAVLDAFRDVAAWGGTAQTTGLTQSEWLTLVARLSSRDAYRLERMATRLSALPVTASLLAAGKLTIDQAAQICDGTTRLSGSKLAEVDRIAAEHAAARNARGDAPDIDVEVDRLVQERRKPRDVEAAERRAIEGSRVFEQQDFDGGGRITADLDALAYPTVSAAINDAAGPPSRDVKRSNQKAEGLVAICSDHLAEGGYPRGEAGTDRDTAETARSAAANPATLDREAPAAAAAATSDADGTTGFSQLDPTGLPGVSASRLITGRRPKVAMALTIDVADATPSTFAQIWRSAAGRHAPHLSARMVDVISCDADLSVFLTDGATPLVELKDRGAIPAAVRRAVLHRDRGCRWPNCTAPPWQCDVHHLKHRADGGDHDVNNLAGLCRRHHMRLHGPHWTVHLDPATGAMTFSRHRDGTRPAHTTYPHGTHPSRSTHPPGVPAPR